MIWVTGSGTGYFKGHPLAYMYVSGGMITINGKQLFKNVLHKGTRIASLENKFDLTWSVSNVIRTIHSMFSIL